MQSLVLAVQQFPVELWKIVFILCLHDEEFVTPSSLSAPLLLCQVCHSWRDLALSTPQLWASLSISRFDEGEGCFPRAELADLWLSRSSNLPLSISFGPDTLFDYVEGDDDVKSMMDVILPTLPRWRNASLCFADLTPGNVDAIPEEGAQCLEKLTLLLPALPGEFYGESFDVGYLAPSVRYLTGMSPKLCNFEIFTNYQGFENVRWSKGIPIIWSQLTTLTLMNRMFFWEGLDILHQCINLVECDFSLIEGYYGIPNYSTKVAQLPILQSLSLAFEKNDVGVFPTPMEIFLDCLHAPALRKLCLTVNGLWSQDSYTSFISRSNCIIESLSLTAMSISSSQFLNCLDLLNTSLVEFKVFGLHSSSKFITNVILDRLSYSASDSTPDHSNILPRLEVLELSSCVLNAEDGRIGDMIESRSVPVADPTNERTFGTLRSVRLNLKKEHWKLYPKDVELLESLNGNMDIFIDYNEH
ncbi:hypothetical protein BDQ12DRAFT_690052 [Crucibulum laeve]|uniref:Uncharacterized protein n=1 Tax=Crucibulum laeve TaxID=68775 RepID=A0A5C3LMS4_9AGAR|nr:hypothetical protein BDQ12DRAFT_690052 [Crucibulum laeve]